MPCRLDWNNILGLGANMYFKSRHIAIKQVSIMFSSFGMIHYCCKYKSEKWIRGGKRQV